MPMTSSMLKKGGPGTSGKVPGFMKKKKNSVRLFYVRYL